MVNEPDMYTRLLRQPLFQGMSKTDIHNIIAHTKFGFNKFKDGETIVKDGSVCNKLIFLTNGKIKAIRYSDDHGYAFSEELAAPEILQPEHIFGLNQRYTYTFTASGSCNLITLDKNETLRLSDEFIIFRLNLLNIITTQTQKITHKWWLAKPTDLRRRIVRFFESHCRKPAGAKTIHIKMERLAEELNDNRLNISRELNKMQSEGLLQLKRAIIHIPSLEKLMM